MLAWFCRMYSSSGKWIVTAYNAQDLPTLDAAINALMHSVVNAVEAQLTAWPV